MKLSVALLLLASVLGAKADTACLTDGAEFELNGCDLETFVEGLKDYLDEVDCSHDAKTELRRIYGTNSVGFIKKSIRSVCAAGWSQVSSSSFSDVDPRFNDSFMNEYVAGDTFLNSEFTNFLHLLCPFALFFAILTSL